jgi:flagellar FliJ protein
LARFEFKLEGVLRHRLNIERERQREFALVQAQMQQLHGELRALDLSARDATEDLRKNQLLGRLDMVFIAAHRRFVTAMQQKAMVLVKEMAALQQQVDVARAALGEAAKQRKIMEKLKEKQQQRWQSEISRKEAEELDEIGMQLSFRHLDAARSADAGGES